MLFQLLKPVRLLGLLLLLPVTAPGGVPMMLAPGKRIPARISCLGPRLPRVGKPGWASLARRPDFSPVALLLDPVHQAAEMIPQVHRELAFPGADSYVHLSAPLDHLDFHRGAARRRHLQVDFARRGRSAGQNAGLRRRFGSRRTAGARCRSALGGAPVAGVGGWRVRERCERRGARIRFRHYPAGPGQSSGLVIVWPRALCSSLFPSGGWLAPGRHHGPRWRNRRPIPISYGGGLPTGPRRRKLAGGQGSPAAIVVRQRPGRRSRRGRSDGDMPGGWSRSQPGGKAQLRRSHGTPNRWPSLARAPAPRCAPPAPHRLESAGPFPRSLPLAPEESAGPSGCSLRLAAARPPARPARAMELRERRPGGQLGQPEMRCRSTGRRPPSHCETAALRESAEPACRLAPGGRPSTVTVAAALSRPPAPGQATQASPVRRPGRANPPSPGQSSPLAAGCLGQNPPPAPEPEQRRREPGRPWREADQARRA